MGRNRAEDGDWEHVDVRLCRRLKQQTLEQLGDFSV